MVESESGWRSSRAMDCNLQCPLQKTLPPRPLHPLPSACLGAEASSVCFSVVTYPDLKTGGSSWGATSHKLKAPGQRPSGLEQGRKPGEVIRSLLSFLSVLIPRIPYQPGICQYSGDIGPQLRLKQLHYVCLSTSTQAEGTM